MQGVYNRAQEGRTEVFLWRNNKGYTLEFVPNSSNNCKQMMIFNNTGQELFYCKAHKWYATNGAVYPVPTVKVNKKRKLRDIGVFTDSQLDRDEMDVDDSDYSDANQSHYKRQRRK